MSDRTTRAWTEFRPRFAMTVVTVFSAGVLVGVRGGDHQLTAAHRLGS